VPVTMLHVGAAWTCSMETLDIQRGHGHAAWT
jgi:hypothetical protein